MVRKRRFSALKCILVCENWLRIEATGAIWKFSDSQWSNFAIHRSFFPKCSGRIHRCLFRHQLTLTKVAFTVSTILLSGARILWFSRSSIVQNRSKAWGTFLLYCWITVMIFCLIVCKAGYTSSAGATADGTCQACALGYYKSSTWTKHVYTLWIRKNYGRCCFSGRSAVW